ncbi:uncharacterized protein BDR25DRAFT_3558 [Lindgomyces ingoldianus]|uniref:Uncharacterized protein n=1 Tax=Lindgomyces ingoldianus TaxID=673940 RepID=A0ACB6RHF0_9PLEO|nr:uncharacterized protein BDR25DRAFT_3558 [Lindgomyces ingoldianus]KAF2477755.1 hypothetical protein BDR25DRAFT_3558 [Lindgomyces ingoldianus]
MFTSASNTPPNINSSGWSKEAIFGLIALFLMIICSSISIVWKCCVLREIKWDVCKVWRPKQKPEDVESGVSYSSTRRFSSRAHTICSWVSKDMGNIRRHQQETYSKLLRMKRT